MAAAEACFRFLPVRARLDLAGFEDEDIFTPRFGRSSQRRQCARSHRRSGMPLSHCERLRYTQATRQQQPAPKHQQIP